MSVASGCLAARVLKNRFTSFWSVELHGNNPAAEQEAQNLFL